MTRVLCRRSVKRTLVLCGALLCFTPAGDVAASDSASSTATTQSLATAWCEKKGGKVFRITNTSKKSSNVSDKNDKCLLPTGELVEIWALYKRDHK